MIKTTERGWPGHFILGSRCIFTRNTLVEHNEIRIVVSTVGLLQELTSEGERQVVPIGMDRYFETKAFHAYKNGVGGGKHRARTYWDADVQREISLNSRTVIHQKDADDLANEAHERAVDEIKTRMRDGYFDQYNEEEWPEFDEAPTA